MPTRHIVLCTVRSGLSVEAIRDAFAPLAASQMHIPGLVASSAGFDTSPRGHGHSPPDRHSQRYNYGIVMDFADATARDAYLHDPRHREAVEATGRVREPGSDILIFNYDYA